MRRVAVIVGVALAVFLTLGLPTAQAQERSFVRGTVTAIAGDTITVKVAGEDMTFNVDKNTNVIAKGAGTKQKQAEQTGEGPKLGDLLKVGEGVEVHYRESGGTKMATEIRGNLSKATVEQQAQGKSVRGKVTAAANDKVTVNSGGKDYEFTVDSKTNVIGRGASTKTAQLKKEGKTPTFTDFVGVGDSVVVSAGPDMKATEVRVTAKATK